MKKFTAIFTILILAACSIQAQSEQVDPATGTKAIEKVQTETTVIDGKTVRTEVKEVQAVEMRKVSRSDAMKVKQMKKASTDLNTVPSDSKQAGSAKKACCASASKNGKACCSSKGMSGKSCTGKGAKSKSSSAEQKIEQ